jgi:hypothetical protein
MSIRNRELPKIPDNLPWLLDERQASELLGVSRSFLRKSRCEGLRFNRTQAPPFVSVGGRRLYRLSDLKEWVSGLKEGASDA